MYLINKILLIIIFLFLNINMIFGYDIRSIFEYKPKFVKPNKSIARIEISEEDKINGIINCFIQSIQDDNFLTIEKFIKNRIMINNKLTNKKDCFEVINRDIEISLRLDDSKSLKNNPISLGNIEIKKVRETYNCYCSFKYKTNNVIFKLKIEKIDCNFKISEINILENKKLQNKLKKREL